jgi:hypothetical protein
MPAYFWEQVGTCLPDVGVLSHEVQFEELTREGHMPKPLSLSSQDILLALSQVGKATAEVNIPTPLERQFQRCYELHN